MYSIIDIESNGAPFRKESIIEIAIYRFDGHEITDQFISLVNPEDEISSFVQKLTGITQKMVITAPKFHEIAKRVVEITQDSILVGHNIDFDYRMLRQSFKRLGYEFKINTLDTIPLAKKLIPEEKSYSLSKLCKSIGIPLSEAHRASGDARATLDLFKLLIIKDKYNEIIQLQQEESQEKNYISKVQILTEDLPNERGIVYFQNKDWKIIYSDVVEDLYKSAKKIFDSDKAKYKKLQDETEKISYELTGTDLIAKLMMQNKGIHKRQQLTFGLFYRKNKYILEKIKLQEDKPLLRFKSFTQGLKAINYIKSKEDLKDFVEFTQKINLKGRNEIWSSSGRTLGEKSFLVLEKGKLIGFGFYELYHQIQSLDKIKKLMLPVPRFTQDLQNDLQLALLRNEYDVTELPKIN
ncbi:3'-5' exonuclease [Epilithonimonas arachidiradicis]|uniref:DNA polymerase-3 subunit epsilon n=1 Tax=Epilithonimonas arachidiradicis TaxID=1617282 RepID=A0A420DCZ5_9FLAO|nr:3'-5' exonuclease [Epilithonimonas arachidiradicis]RKE89694.1 DNA polymerase-3 subunit epsilon [Epilithonimonas arachidiradicis]GGG44537.1 exonuclease [Epilithonimonas arachidiradicis]